MISRQVWSVLLRWCLFLLAGASYGGVAILAYAQIQGTILSSSWPLFLVSALVSLSFFSVGCILWWYARQRHVAMLSFLSCTVLSLSLLCVAPVDYVNSSLVEGISSCCAATGIFLLLLLFLHFPHRLLYFWVQSGWRMRILWGWLSVLGLLGLLSALYCVTLNRLPPPALFEPWYNGYYLGTMFTLLGVLGVASRMQVSRRERQQFRLLGIGAGLGLAPYIGFSILPALFHALWPAIPIIYVPDIWTLPSLLLIPVTMGYTVLRYQFLIFDAVVARVVFWLVRGLGLAFCVSLELISISYCPHTLLMLLILTGLFGGAAIWIWSVARRIGLTLLFAEGVKDSAMIAAALQTPAQTRDLPTLAETLRHLLTLTCGSQDAYLLVRDEASGLYRLAERLSPPESAPLKQALELIIQHYYPAPPADEFQLTPGVRTHLMQARRPSFLQEVVSHQEHSAFLAPDAAQMLLVGLKASDQLLGFLVVGARSDRQPYAGTDLEMVSVLASRVLPVFKMIVQQMQRGVQLQTLEEAFAHTTLLARLAPEDLSSALIELFARYLPAQVELWEQREHIWHRLALAGAHTDAWSTEQTRRFLSQDNEQPSPLFASEGLPGHPLPFLLLPLEGDPSRPGCLLAHYTRPSLFLPDRRQMLALVARHAGRMLREAYERADVWEENPRALAPTLINALCSLSEAAQYMLDTFSQPPEVRKAGLDQAEWARLREQWEQVQARITYWPHPRLLLPSPASEGVVLLVVNHPLLADVLVRACACRGNPVTVQPTAHKSLQWLREAPRNLSAVVIDEDALTLDLEVFLHAVMEYVPDLPLWIVCTEHSQPQEKGNVLAKMAFLPKPFALGHLFHLLGWRTDWTH